MDVLILAVLTTAILWVAKTSTDPFVVFMAPIALGCIAIYLLARFAMTILALRDNRAMQRKHAAITRSAGLGGKRPD